MNTKKRIFVVDPNLEKLTTLSAEYFELAKQTLIKGDRLYQDIDTVKLIQELDSLRDSVREFNDQEAHILCSEAVADINLMYYPGAKWGSRRMYEYMEQLSPHELKEVNQRRFKNQLKYTDTNKDGHSEEKQEQEQEKPNIDKDEEER